ncbi:FAD binding domain-containing protein [Roseomonas sp. SSH11]|uniref:FAD binding domain-containing protein n=1 Tax=Pararoseomonas baculiformis TaxID=2820812 RepID=A0ABS4AAP1_9PROT|nr:FAD binding domain-containing protein [Pararoseomonas baculiformis]MBP0444067.1 FAD binding domain-containing protein [Pararoseomonas baculiformis]
MNTSGPIAFTLNGAPRSLPAATSPTMTLLDWLRGPAGLTGTKEGCAEGDCGACTVVIEEADGSRVPVNACLALLGQMHGHRIRTVEGLRGPAGSPHPVQRLLAEADATQCGFCTPGIVMTAWAHAREGGDPHDALAGNLCRCTGYRPIVEAFAALEDDGAAPPPAPAATARQLESPGQVFHRPDRLRELLELRAAHPEAWLLAGGTDLGLRVSERREAPPVVICLSDVPELKQLEVTPAGLRVGAAVTYRRLLAAIAAEPGYIPLVALLRRLGSRQIRGMGTLGGNLGTASPIGDALPPLIALGATLRLAGFSGERVMPVETFLTGYRQNALGPGEVIREVWIPRPPAGSLFAAEKLSKRPDQDIATVGLSALLTLKAGRVVAARVALGGTGPRAARCAPAEASLTGQAWSREVVEAAAAALEGAIAPLSDLRGSAAYRRIVAGNLLRRLWHRASEAA